MKAIDPRTVWLSDRVLLSEVMGCDSVYRYGIPNRIYDTDEAKLAEARYLMENLGDFLHEYVCSFTYGYISPRLSKAIVRYQDPNKPSYHRWDAGAAVDLVAHSPLFTINTNTNMDNTAPPIYHLRDRYREGRRWSRAITYAESPVFCYGTRQAEGGKPRMATYENMYVKDQRKPEFKKLSPKQLLEICARPGWKGKGWPSYHGGGRRQYEHIRTGTCNVLSDFLYDAISVHKGIPNKPPLGKAANEKFMTNIIMASLWYEKMTYAAQQRFPIVGAYVDPKSRHTKIDRSFQERWVVDIEIPPGTDPFLYSNVISEAGTLAYSVETHGSRCTVVGNTLEQMTYFDDIQEAVDYRLGQERQTFKRGMKNVQSSRS